ncbi:MAG: hypothetical protein WCK32_08920 [Chlorobiaceae bacterium]
MNWDFEQKQPESFIGQQTRSTTVLLLQTCWGKYFVADETNAVWTSATTSGTSAQARFSRLAIEITPIQKEKVA